MTTAREVVDRFLAAVESRDVDAVAECFAPDATYQNVPHPPYEGREAIRELFGRALGRCEKVRWDIVTESDGEDRVWLERVDRFWVAGVEYAIECNGVWDVDVATSSITAVRDYLDYHVWLGRSAPMHDA
jgi:limonene-1,2-epoxide hydrolase